MLKGIKAILFDMDGTLIDSMWVWNGIDVAYLNRFGYELPDGLQREIEGMSFTETAIYLKKRFSIPDSIEKMKADWTEMAFDFYTHQVPLKNGARELIAYCHAHDIRLGIATSNEKTLVTATLNALHIYEDFDGIVTGCDVVKGKPDPEIYLTCAKKCGVAPRECLVFEDLVPGIIAARNAGMKVCAIEDAYSADQAVEKRTLADDYIPDFTAILDLANLSQS